jgi:hypothetical protein
MAVIFDKLVSRAITTRNLRQSGESFYNLIETQEEEVLEAYAVEASDVNTVMNANTQPDPVEGSVVAYSYDAQLVSKETNRYNITRTYTKKTISFPE